jgi:predicted permease
MRHLARFCSTLLADIRHALRGLRRAPGYSATAVLTLAIGLGATASMLAIIDCVLIQPVALPHADRLVQITRSSKGVEADNFDLTDIANLARAHSFTAITGYNSFPEAVTIAGSSRIAQNIGAQTTLFPIAGVAARIGRVFGPGEEHSPVAVVSDRYWTGSMHADPHAVGTQLRMDGKLYTVIGVLPPSFDFPMNMQGESVYTPLQFDAKGKDQHGFTSAFLVGRLKPGVSSGAAAAELQAIYRQSIAKNSSDPEEKAADWQVHLAPYGHAQTGTERPALFALLGASLLLLLIACANTANLQIARGITRAPEMSMRSTLGASRARLLQQLATESIVVSALGACAGLFLAGVLITAVRHTYSDKFPRFDELALHPSVFLSCAALAILVGLLAALVPASQALRHAGQSPSANSSRSTRRSRLPGMLVALELALTCVLLAVTGLFIRTFRALEQVPLGFNPHHLTVISTLPLNPQSDPEVMRQVERRVLHSLAALPGVQGAATETSLPYSQMTLSLTSTIRIAGRPQKKNDGISISLISAGWSRTLGVPILQGRSLTDTDGAGAAPVCLVNQAFVRTHLTGQRVLGTSILFPNESKDATDGRLLRTPFTIVGIVPDQNTNALVTGAPDPVIFLDTDAIPATAGSRGFLFVVAPQFAVRSTLPKGTLDREIRAVLKRDAPELAEMGITPVDTAMQAALANRRLALRLASGFGALALLLSAIGIYGVLAYAVAQRRREIGIRMALGSSRAAAVRLIAGQAVVMALTGLALGLLASWPAGRAVRSLLFGVHAVDPLTALAAALVLLFVCCLAALIPAWRAAQVDPNEALRSE